jgi:hypothetical protein
VLALRQREIMAERRGRAQAAASAERPDSAATDTAPTEAAPSVYQPDALKSREAIARAARLSSSQVVAIEKIQKQAAPEVVAAVKSGTISLNTAAAVATLPAEEQVAAAHAGKDELKLAAKRVREAKRKPREEATPETATPVDAEATDAVQALQRQVAQLQAENAALRQQVQALEAQLV